MVWNPISHRLRFEVLKRLTITKSRVRDFIQTARNIAGRDACSPFSLEDVYSVAYQLGLSGMLLLEKSDNYRHVTVLLGLDESSAMLYDPLSGVKVKACNAMQFGMYCKPVGSLRDEFQKYEQQFTLEECSDVWARYEQNGKLLLRFLRQHSEFRFIFFADVSSIVKHVGLPALQNKSRSSDCAPICLFIISLMHPATNETSLQAIGSASGRRSRSRLSVYVGHTAKEKQPRSPL